MANILTFPKAHRDPGERALAAMLMALVGLHDRPETRQLKREMRRQWLDDEHYCNGSNGRPPAR